MVLHQVIYGKMSKEAKMPKPSFFPWIAVYLQIVYVAHLCYLQLRMF